MENKIWILRDSDGHLPTEAEAATFRDWMCRDKFAPRVNCRESYDKNGNTVRCEWKFWANETGRTMLALDSENANLHRVNRAHVELLDAVKLAMEAGDKPAVRKLLGIED